MHEDDDEVAMLLDLPMSASRRGPLDNPLLKELEHLTEESKMETDDFLVPVALTLSDSPTAHTGRAHTHLLSGLSEMQIADPHKLSAQAEFHEMMLDEGPASIEHHDSAQLTGSTLSGSGVPALPPLSWSQQLDSSSRQMEAQGRSLSRNPSDDRLSQAATFRGYDCFGRPLSRE